MVIKNTLGTFLIIWPLDKMDNSDSRCTHNPIDRMYTLSKTHETVIVVHPYLDYGENLSEC